MQCHSSLTLQPLVSVVPPAAATTNKQSECPEAKNTLRAVGETAKGDRKKIKLFLTSEASFSNSPTLAWVELYA